MTIELPEKLEAALKVQANAHGVSPRVMFARFLNVISRPRSNTNHRVLRSKRDAACSPNTDRLHRQRKSTLTAPICSRTSVNILMIAGVAYPHRPLAFIRRQETVGCRRSLYQRRGDRKTQDCHFDHKPSRGGLFDEKNRLPSSAYDELTQALADPNMFLQKPFLAPLLSKPCGKCRAPKYRTCLTAWSRQRGSTSMCRLSAVTDASARPT